MLTEVSQIINRGSWKWFLSNIIKREWACIRQVLSLIAEGSLRLRLPMNTASSDPTAASMTSG